MSGHCRDERPRGYNAALHFIGVARPRCAGAEPAVAAFGRREPPFAFGLPITDAYGVTVRVKGARTPILFQCFQCRCLTYNPANPSAFRVEMGNVGQHYYAWRLWDPALVRVAMRGRIA